MPSHREQIKLTGDEIDAYLRGSKTLICSTNGPRGFPHSMPLWFVMRGIEPWAWTFAKSQKAQNLTRDPRATLVVEDGVSYDKLRGVMIEAQVEVIGDVDVVRELAIELFTKYGGGSVGPEVMTMIDAQVPKRLAMRFEPRRYVSWDHSKLGGGYVDVAGRNS